MDYFKECSCSFKWLHRDDFIADKQIELIGYTPNFKKLELGWFFFNHHDCKTTLAIEARCFTDLYDGTIFKERKFGTRDCPGHCLHRSDLEPCPIRCECAFIRETIQIIKNRHGSTPPQNSIKPEESKMQQIVVIILRNRAGHFFVHRRKQDKKTFPGLYGLGAGGRMEPGETRSQAARRELFEETGIAATPDYLFSLDYSDATTAHRIHVFHQTYNGTIQSDQREWEWSGWMTPEAVNELDRQEQLCPDTQRFYRQFNPKYQTQSIENI